MGNASHEFQERERELVLLLSGAEWGILHMKFRRERHMCYDSGQINWGRLF